MSARQGMLLAAAVVVIASGALAREPVIGGPCEGCEIVFTGMPAELEAVSRIAPPEEPGAPMVITGTVRTEDGMPAAGIVVYAYHTNAEGIYPIGVTRHGKLRGWARTDASGAYRFDTIRPGAYPTGGAPEHVHMHVIEPGRGTYWIDDLLFADDPRLTPEHRRGLSHRGGDGVATPARDVDGDGDLVWRVTRDITLGRNIPDYQEVR